MTDIEIINDLCVKHSYPNHIFVPSSIRDRYIDELRLCARYEAAAMPSHLLTVTYGGTVIRPWPEGELCG